MRSGPFGLERPRAVGPKLAGTSDGTEMDERRPQPTNGEPRPEPTPRPSRAPFWVAVVVATTMVVGGVVVVGGVMMSSPDDHVASVAPGGTLDLDTVSAELAAHYHFADAHRSMYEAVPCFCGCEAMLDHRSLLDCFVRPDGSGWERHASGCAVCVQESRMVRRMLGNGMAPQAISSAVIDRFE